MNQWHVLPIFPVAFCCSHRMRLFCVLAHCTDVDFVNKFLFITCSGACFYFATVNRPTRYEDESSCKSSDEDSAADNSIHHQPDGKEK